MAELQVVYGELWEMEGIKCVTTNGTVVAGDGPSLPPYNVMGGGVARQARVLEEEKGNLLDVDHGAMIMAHGQHVFLIRDLIMFPTKKEVSENSDLETISHSFWELSRLWNIYKWERILLPAPGAGLGGLQWEEVEVMLTYWTPILEEFTSHVTIVRYEKEKP